MIERFLSQWVRQMAMGAVRAWIPSKSALFAVVMAGLLSTHGIAQQAGQYGSNDDPSTICLAKYTNGDWDYDSHFDAKGKIDGGGLYHLVGLMNDWGRSHGSFKVVVKWIDCNSPKWPSLPPRAIIFTGSKDFILTDQEIKTLRSYLDSGGRIWGNNAKGGLGSSFDVAFRREMRRIIPNFDKKFEAIGPKDPVLTKYIFDLTNSQLGMSMVEQLDIDGEVAIIYSCDNLLDDSIAKQRLGMNIVMLMLIPEHSLRLPPSQ